MDALLLGLGEIFADFNFVMKLFVLITIVSWVRNHFGNSAISWALIIGVSTFVLFDLWWFFGGIFVLYLLLTIGVTGILIDYFFLTQQQGAPSESKPDLVGNEVRGPRGEIMHARPPPLRPGPPV